MNRIKEARIEAGLTQQYIALSLGVKPPSVSNWESGKSKPTQENLKALSQLLGVSVDYLVGFDGEPPAPPPQDPPAWSQYGPETRKILREILGKLEGMDDEQLKAVEVVVDALGKKK